MICYYNYILVTFEVYLPALQSSEETHYNYILVTFEGYKDKAVHS